MIIQFLITKMEANSLKTQAIIIMLTNGHDARLIEITLHVDENPNEYIEANLKSLWDTAEPAPLQQYRAAVQRALDPLINNTINAIYGVFVGQAEPTAESIFAAAEAVLQDTPKMLEWERLTAMLQSMSDTELRRFLALTITINMSKSARG
jgi:hypothetical protein